MRNKLTLLIGLMVLAFAVNAQKQTNPISPDLKVWNSVEKIVKHDRNVSDSKAPVFTEDFSTGVLPAGWLNVDNGTTGLLWQFDNPGGREFHSSSASNGFAIFDSDNYGDGTAWEYADLISPAIDCSALSVVALSFEHYFRAGYGGEGYVSVSGDNGATWTDFLVLGAESTNNAQLEILNISSVAAGQSQVMIKFTWIGAYSWYWAVDDISVGEPELADEFKIADIVVPSLNTTGVQSTISATITNLGATTQSKDVTFLINGELAQAVTSSTMAFGGAETVSIDWTPTMTGQYNIAVSINPDDNNANNSLEKEVVVVVEGQLAENFEGAMLPYGWSETVNGSNWVGSTSRAFIGTTSALMEQTKEEPAEMLITPPLVLDGSVTTLSYWTKGVNNIPSYGTSKLQIKIKNVDSAEWVNLGDVDDYGVSGDGLRFVEVPLDTLEDGIYYFAFHTVSSFYYEAVPTIPSGVLLDNIIGPEVANLNTVTFAVADADSNPIEGAVVNINNYNLTTDVNGEASHAVIDGTYEYTASLYGYYDKTGTITVAGADVSESVTMDLMPVVLFTVTDGIDPLEGVNIAIDGYDLTTAADGTVEFALADGTYNYTASLDGYYVEIGSVIISGTVVTKNIELAIIPVFTLPYTENFTDNTLGDLYAYSVVGDQIWGTSSYGNPAPGAYITGYVDPNYLENGDWLITPGLDFSGVTNAYMTFDEAIRYTGSVVENHKVFASTDYTGAGDPSVATWTELTITGRSTADTWDWFSVNPFDLTSYAGEAAVYIAFVYTSNTTVAGTWELDNVNVQEGVPSYPPEIADVTLSPAQPSSSDAVSISATITDIDGTIDSAILHWGNLAFYGNEIKMSLGTGNTWVTDSEIPAQDANTLTFYKIVAYDNDLNEVETDPLTYSVYDPYAGTLPFYEPFHFDLGIMEQVSVTGDNTWYWDEYNSDGYATASGYSGGSVANEDYLITPMIDLSQVNSAALNFREAINLRGNIGIVSDNVHQVFVSTDYTNDVTTATWTELTITGRNPIDNNFTWVDVDEISLDDYAGESSVYIAFKYQSTNTANSTWLIDNISITGGETYIDFETNTDPIGYDFGGNAHTFGVANPNTTGNASATVGEITTGEETWSGIAMPIGGSITFSPTDTTFTIDVLSDVTGAVLFKLEDANDANTAVEVSADYTTAGEWQTLEYNFPDTLNAGVYSQFVFFFNNGTSDITTWYFDNVVGPAAAFGGDVDVNLTVDDKLGLANTSIELDIAGDVTALTQDGNTWTGTVALSPYTIVDGGGDYETYVIVDGNTMDTTTITVSGGAPSMDWFYLLLIEEEEDGTALAIDVDGNAPVIDGTIDEVWANAEIHPLQQRDYYGSPTGLYSYFKVMYDLNNVYILNYVDDATPHNGGTDPWDNDNVTLYFDMNQSASAGFDNDDWQIRCVRGLDTWTGSANVTDTWAEDVDRAQAELANSTGYVVEWAIPWVSLSSSFLPLVGTEFNIDVTAADDIDGVDGRDYIIAWNTNLDQNYNNTSLYGTVTLSDMTSETGLKFQVNNAQGNPISGAKVDLDSYGVKYTDYTGGVSFTEVNAGSDVAYTVTAIGYDTVISVINNVQLTVDEIVTLNNLEYEVTFSVTDGVTTVEGIEVSLDGYGSAVTDADGNALFTPVVYETNINYSADNIAYDAITGTLDEIVSDTVIDLVMNLSEFQVVFNVSDGTDNISGASVTLDGQGTKLTDAFGYVAFDGIGYTTDVSYQVAANSYDTISDIIDVLASDITENITMVLTRYDVTFTVTDGANPIEGATISLTGSADQTTDVNGQVVFTQLLPATDIAYSVNAPGYLESSGMLSVVDSDVVENVQLDPITYQVTFVVDDGVNVLSGAEVSLSGYGTKSTNASGEVFFNNVLPAANISYNVLLAGYFSENGTVTVSTTDKNVNVSLSENTSTYRVEFNVTDGSGAIANAIVMLDGYGSQTTNAFGEAIFNDVSPESGITYLVTANNYNQVTGTVDVIEQDVTKQVTMELIAYSVTFTVTDGTSPVDGADVSLSGYGLQTTDVTGQAIFTEVVPEADIAYIINKTDFEEYTGTITVINSNVSIDLRLTPVGLSDQHNIEFSVYPNPSNGILNLQIAGEAQVKIMNMSGAVVYNNQIINKQAIDVSNLNSGVYVMQIRQNDRIATQQIILK